MIYQGACHCHAVKFEVEAPQIIEAVHCNCSVCQKSGLLHLIVPLKNFTLLEGESYLTSYRFNTEVANHTFCRICGIKSFYTPRSNPDGVSVNVRCLETPAKEIRVKDFDGQNWEQHASSLAHLSK